MRVGSLGVNQTEARFTTSAEAFFSRLAIVFFVAVFVYLVCFFAFADIRFILCFLPDDAAYYFRISENIAAGKGSTFDGINLTNGYQPLWLVLLIPVSSVFHATPEAMTRIYLIYETIILLCAGWLFWLAHAKFFRGHVRLFCGILFTYLVFYSSANGMDSGVLVLALGLLYYSGYRLEVFTRPHAGRTVLFGTLVGLTMLARLDTVFLGAALLSFCLFQASRRPLQRRFWLSKLLQLLLGATIVCLPYLVYNALHFDTVVPISAVLKSSFPDPSFNANKLWHMGKRPLLFGALAVAYLIWALLGFLRGYSRNNYFRTSLTILAFAILLHFMNRVFFMRWAVFDWHFIPYSLFATLVASEPLERALRLTQTQEHKRLLVITAALAFVGLSYRIVDKTLLVSYEKSFHVHSYTAALWARERSRPSDVFAMKDAGIFGYLSQRSVINLDGVVNNLSFQEVVKSQKLGTYLKNNKVKYLVQHKLGVGDRTLLPKISLQTGGDATEDYITISLRYKSQKYGTYSDPIVVDRACEVYRAERWDGQKTLLPFTIWRLGNCDSTSDGYGKEKG